MLYTLILYYYLICKVIIIKAKQAAEVNRRRARVREAPTHENSAKLQAAEAKMQELKSNMAVLGKEAAGALSAVESQQQRLTFQRLVALVYKNSSYINKKTRLFVKNWFM